MLNRSRDLLLNLGAMIQDKDHGYQDEMSKAKAHISRRDFLWMATSSTLAMGQGVTTRNLKPLPRGKPSGIPFLAALY